MKAPTTLGLFAGKTPIHDQIVVEVGKRFSISVVVDEPVGVRLEITPALPSTVRFNASVIAGVLFEGMNQTYTLTASNARGSVWTELRVFVERDSEYYLQCDAGRAKVTVREGVTGLVEVMEQGDTEPVDGDSVFVSAFCYSIDGCALTLHSFDDGALPPFLLHYNEEANITYTLPVRGFSFSPISTNTVALLHQPIATLFWAVEGFCRASFRAVPSWLHPSSPSSLDGVAEESGVFTFPVTLSNSTHSFDIQFNVTVVDAFSANHTLVSFVVQNEAHSPSLPLFSFRNNSLAVSFITLTSPPFTSFTQQLLLPAGVHHVTLPATESHRIDVFMHSVCIASRLAPQTTLWFYIEESVREDDFLLQFLFDESPGRWTERSYDDGIWDMVIPGEISVIPSQPLLFRKHFVVEAASLSSLALSLTVWPGANVYLNGELIWRINTSKGCAKGCESVVVDGESPLTRHHMTVSRRLYDDDNVIAVQLFPFENDTQPVFLSMSVFPVVAPVVLTSPSTPIASAYSVLDVELLLIPHT